MSALTASRSYGVKREIVSYGVDERSRMGQLVATVLKPVQVITSRSAVKVYLKALLFTITSTVLISISAAAYAWFYYQYIPQINLETTIHLQYVAGTHPHATIPLHMGQLVSLQPYDVQLVLHIPRTPSNVAAGNFMLDLSLLTTTPSNKNDPSPQPSATLPEISLPSGYTTIERSRRPAILPYTSRITSLCHTLLHLPWHLLSLRDLDSSKLTVSMFEHLSFPRSRASLPTHAHIEIQSNFPLTQPNLITPPPNINLFPLSTTPQPASSSQSIQIYTARLIFHAHFEGLRYIVYNYRILSFLVCTSLFYLSTVSTTCVVWALISSLSRPKSKPQPQDSTTAAAIDGISKTDPPDPKIKPDPETTTTRTKISLYNIKSEEDDEDITPDTSDAELEARTTGLVTDHHLDAEDEDEDDSIIKTEDVVDDDKREVHVRGSGTGDVKFTDSGIGTSLESEVASGLSRRRSGRRSDGGEGGHASASGSGLGLGSGMGQRNARVDED